MTGVDWWAVLAASVASCAFAARRHMLSPQLATWAAACGMVQAGVGAAAVALAMCAITICGGAHATAREAAVYSVIAVYAVSLALNLHLTRAPGRA